MVNYGHQANMAFFVVRSSTISTLLTLRITLNLKKEDFAKSLTTPVGHTVKSVRLQWSR